MATGSTGATRDRDWPPGRSSAWSRRRDELGFQSIGAGTLPHIVGSQTALRRCGFEQYGVARAYLELAGRWQDHVLCQRILRD